MITYLINLLFMAFPSEAIIEVNLTDIQKAQNFHQLTHVNENCAIISFNLIVMPKDNNGNIVEVINQGEKLNEKSLRQLAKVKVGDTVYLDKVKSVADCLKYQGVGHQNFVLKIAAE